MDAIDFMKAFHPDGPWVLAAIVPDGPIETESFGPASESNSRKWVAKYNGKRNLYFTVNLPLKAMSKKPARRDIGFVRYLHVDIDACVGEPLEDELSRIRQLVTDGLPPNVPEPTVIVFTGGGCQCYWRLIGEPFKGDLKRAESYNKQLAAFLTGDSCHSIDHLMRLPGTENIPNKKKIERGRIRVGARVEKFDPELVYSIEEFLPAEEAADGSSGAPSTADLSELDEWPVSDRIKRIIKLGKCPDEEDKPSRSEWLFATCCGLVRSGVPDGIIESIISNPNYPISESVLERDPAYAKRQVEKARQKVMEEPPVLSPQKPFDTARVFVVRCRPTLMHYNDDWLAFDQSAYVVLEENSVRANLYRFMEKALLQGKEKKPFSPNRGRVGDVMDALAGLVHRQRIHFEPPCWLSGEGPNPTEVVACRNGLLHLPTMELQAPTPRFFTLNALKFEYKMGAAKPVRWLEFLRELWTEEDDVIDVLQEVFGYLLVPDTSQQKIFLLVGPPRSGKGTIARVLTDLVGKLNTCAPTLKSMSGDFGLQPLIGKQLAIISDLRLGPKSDHAAIAENLLRISGEDLVTANRKYQREWNGRLAVRFLILTNEFPRFTDASRALPNRFVPIVMRESFLGRENPNLLREILPEMPGILEWSIQGWQRLRDRGHFQVPKSSREAIEQIEDLASPVSAFLRDECEMDVSAVVAKRELYVGWRQWCAANGMAFPGTMEVFSSKLFAATSGAVEAFKPRVGGERVPSYRGLRLKEVPF